MLGLLQADLPIGHRLWIMILTLVVSGSLSKEAVSFSQDPVNFTVEVLLFFGYASLIGALVGVALVVPGGLVSWFYRDRLWKKGDRFNLIVERHATDHWFAIAEKASFVIGAFLAIPGFRSAEMRQLGELGLGLLLFVEVVGVDFLNRSKAEFLELKRNSPNSLSVRYHVEDCEEVEEFERTDAWLPTLGRLISKGWILVHSTNANNLEELILSREHVRAIGEFRPLQKRRAKTKPEGEKLAEGNPAEEVQAASTRPEHRRT